MLSNFSNRIRNVVHGGWTKYKLGLVEINVTWALPRLLPRPTIYKLDRTSNSAHVWALYWAGQVFIFDVFIISAQNHPTILTLVGLILVRSERPFCGGNCGLFITGTFFTCFECFGVDHTKCFYLCQDCFKEGNFVKKYLLILENYALLHALGVANQIKTVPKVINSRYGW